MILSQSLEFGSEKNHNVADVYPMRTLILVAHGSRREASNQEIRALTEALARQGGERFDRVSCAFLELVEVAEDLPVDVVMC